MKKNNIVLYKLDRKKGRIQRQAFFKRLLKREDHPFNKIRKYPDGHKKISTLLFPLGLVEMNKKDIIEKAAKEAGQNMNTVITEHGFFTCFRVVVYGHLR
ncbi:MAG: hypothetical protein D3924_18755 [Candidatus Electrothrix sp. AR4]|nr:hypothetical protein [Candidatus Electrothrix sp. AR4]